MRSHQSRGGKGPARSPAPRPARRDEPAAAPASPRPEMPFTLGAVPVAAPSVQRRPHDMVNGISHAENAAVSHLSGGRVDLHGMGASLQRVGAADSRLTSVGARSLAQGSTALISDNADRGHELWHVAQQAMGKVKPTGSVGGVPVNTSQSLESEADRMGGAIRNWPRG